MGKIIGFSLNDVMRDFTGQMIYIHNKYFPSRNLIGNGKEMNVFENYQGLGFKDLLEYNKFLYDEASLELFGQADQLEDNLFGKFNEFLVDMADDSEHQVCIISREFNKSIPASLFFLSKTLCKAKNIKFVTHPEEVWDHVDVLVTANPKSLDSKPDGKTSIKITTPYNLNNKSDYTFDSVTELFDVDEIEKYI